MPERFSNWIVFACGIGLSGLMLGGCRTPHVPEMPAMIKPETPPVPAEPESEDVGRAEVPATDNLAENIRHNLERGEVEESAGRPDQAARYYERILRDDPQHAEAHSRLAKIAAASRDHRQAERHLRAAIANRPESAELWTDLAQCCAAQGRPEDARDALQRAVGLAGEGSQVALGPGGQATSPEIIRTAQLGPPDSPNLVNQPESKVETDASHAQPYLPSEIIRQKRTLADAVPKDIHLASLEATKESREAVPEPALASETASDGGLPLWE